MSKPRVLCPKSNIRPMSEANNRVWHITAPADHSLADVLSPAYLAPRIKDLRVGDEFTLRSEADVFLVKCYVQGTDADAGTITFAILEIFDLASLPTIAADFADAVVRHRERRLDRPER